MVEFDYCSIFSVCNACKTCTCTYSTMSTLAIVLHVPSRAISISSSLHLVGAAEPVLRENYMYIERETERERDREREKDWIYLR